MKSGILMMSYRLWDRGNMRSQLDVAKLSLEINLKKWAIGISQ